MNLIPVYKRIKAENGAEKTRSRHMARIEKMMAAVEDRFPEVKQVQQVQKKHCEWLLEHWVTPPTAKDFRSSLRLFIEARERDHWLKLLGMAPRSAGGRPRNISIVRSRSSKYWMDE